MIFAICATAWVWLGCLNALLALKAAGRPIGGRSVATVFGVNALPLVVAIALHQASPGAGWAFLFALGVNTGICLGRKEPS